MVDFIAVIKAFIRKAEKLGFTEETIGETLAQIVTAINLLEEDEDKES